MDIGNKFCLKNTNTSSLESKKKILFFINLSNYFIPVLYMFNILGSRMSDVKDYNL